MDPALRMIHRFALSSGELVFEVGTLRRPEFVLRFTNCQNVAVDERFLTSAFPLVPTPSRLVAIVMVAGCIDLEHGGLIEPGDSILVDISTFGRIRSKNACHLNLEWASNERALRATPCRLGRPALEQVMKIAGALFDRNSAQRSTLANAFELFRTIGAPLTLSVEGLEGEPSSRDRRFARAMEEQLENVASRATTTFHMGDSLGLTERQIHRLVEDFNTRYGINARSWRDARNRWRIQSAALLLSRLELTVADVAREVGYASPNALARAFSKVGFPPPAIVRRQMSEMDPSR